jgi:glutamine synthetase
MTRLVELSDYIRDVVAALGAQDVTVMQIHPEYAAGQFEVSVAAEDPVGAADTAVLVKETVRAASARHGLRASFSPAVVAGAVGNGGHVHLSLWQADTPLSANPANHLNVVKPVNLMTGGDGPFGLSGTAAAFTAGILGRLPALLALGAPSVASYLRLVPSHWAGVFACWGAENREAALRLIRAVPGEREAAANLEVKCVDLAANPYLLLAGLLAAGRAGIAVGAELPEPVDIDPASLADAERERRGIRRLPVSLDEALAAFLADDALRDALGEELIDTVAAVRSGEIALFADATPEQVAAATRWLH